MERKTYSADIKQLDDRGHGVAVISTLGVVDKDGDVTLPGAFGVGQTVPIVPGHDWQHVPIGKGRIREEGSEALVDFQLNMKLGIARAWHEHLKFDLETPPAKQEWSYGFSIPPGGAELRELGDGRRGRVLKRLQVHEVSPVLVGAGVNTRTLGVKQVQDLAAASRAAVAAYWRLRERVVKRMRPSCPTPAALAASFYRLYERSVKRARS